MTDFIEKDRYRIFLGFTDRFTMKQEMDPHFIASEIADYLSETETGFSFKKIGGGYVTENNITVNENSLEITLIDFSDGAAEKLSEKIKVFLNQERVLMTHDRIEVMYL